MLVTLLFRSIEPDFNPWDRHSSYSKRQPEAHHPLHFTCHLLSTLHIGRHACRNRVRLSMVVNIMNLASVKAPANRPSIYIYSYVGKGIDPRYPHDRQTNFDRDIM